MDYHNKGTLTLFSVLTRGRRAVFLPTLLVCGFALFGEGYLEIPTEDGGLRKMINESLTILSSNRNQLSADGFDSSTNLD